MSQENRNEVVPGGTTPSQETPVTPPPPVAEAPANAPAQEPQPNGEGSEKPKRKKKKKIPYVDDGHTIYDMSCLRKPGEASGAEHGVGLTRREKWAAIWAAFCHYVPALLATIGGFALTFLLIYFWLKP